MGYTTDFFGCFEFDKKLKPEHSAYLHKFSETRRMQRNLEKLLDMPDIVRVSANLHLGIDGAYFTGGKGLFGQDYDDSIINYNSPPCGQPGLWCQWIPTSDDHGICWNGVEKFYNYREWLVYLINHFFIRWEYTLSGRIQYLGEDKNDYGFICVQNNIICD